MCGLLLPNACAAAPPPHTSRPCPHGFDATFIQLSERDFTRDVQGWQEPLDLLRRVGVELIVVQYTGDEHGSYDARTLHARPVRALLEAARARRMHVYLGLYADPRWPHDPAAVQGLPAPLSSVSGRAWFADLNRDFDDTVVGFYIPHEIDELTWSSAEASDRIAAFLQRTAAALHELGPGKPIAIAPFYAESQPPAAFAQFWKRVLAQHPVDVLMLQDGAGARGTHAATIAHTLNVLRAALRPLHVALWAVVEVFEQRGGPPVDEGEFAAVPRGYARVQASIDAERPWVQRLIAFSVLDYMDPERGPEHERLYTAYLDRCRR